MKPIRKKKKSNIKSTSDRLRLSVFCSNKFIYAQLIDDSLGKTIASSSSLKQKNGGNKEAAKKVGAEITIPKPFKILGICFFGTYNRLLDLLKRLIDEITDLPFLSYFKEILIDLRIESSLSMW